MKRHLLLLLLLVPLWAPAQTVDALFGKYKTAENAVYAIIPPETLTEHELYRGSKVTFAESLVLERGEDTGLADDLKALSGYEQIDIWARANMDSGESNIFLDALLDEGLACYARKRGKRYSEVLAVIPLTGIWTLVHIKGRLQESVLVAISARQTGVSTLGR